MTSEPDREYLDQTAARIDRAGVTAEHHSNPVSAASRLHHLYANAAADVDRNQLEAEIDAVLWFVEGREPNQAADDLRLLLLGVAEGAVEQLAARSAP